MIRNLIFDWSGTLADDLPPVLDATNQLLAFYQRPRLSEEEFREMFQLPFKGFYDQVLPEIPLSELEERFGRYFAASQAPVVLIPHAREFLEFADAAGMRLFILSSARTDFLARQARELDVAHFFERIHASVVDKRHALPGILGQHGLPPEETAFIGDMVHDVETALASGVHAVAVLTGYDSAEKLLKSGPEIIVRHLGRLHKLLQREPAASSPSASVVRAANSSVSGDGKGLVFVEGLDVTTRIGVGDEERSKEQTLEVDLDLEPTLDVAASNDDIANTIDYAVLSEEVRALAANSQCHLVEQLATDILDHLLTRFPVRRATVRIRKRILPWARSVGVQLTAERPASKSII